ncbi:MAG: rRNA maturation RNase YbeY [Zoogloeaceae bacterium]|nr:rRNA maturation RNase YbeY [Zoogloeaceae bacterium]
MKLSRRLNLSVQYACNPEGLPSRTLIRRWARAALEGGGQVTVRYVDADEGRQLNKDYRGKDYATNVLSFVYENDPLTVGDLVICVPVVEREASAQARALEAHHAHLLVHGMLHLQGYDHETGEEDARVMEAKEVEVLAVLGYADPYEGE